MKCITIEKGLDLLILGEPNQDDAPERKEVRHVAITGPDYVGMKPTILVEPGEKVLAGQPLLEDKKTPGVKFTSPAAGTVVNVVRGEKRAFRSIIVETAEGDAAKESVAFEKFERGALSELSSEKVREQLIRSGLWTALRTRPFSRSPRIDSVPVALFVNAADTNPHAPDPKLIIDADRDAFLDGLRVLSKICGQKMWVCFGKGDYDDAFIRDVEAVPSAEAVQFLGKHPSGLTGTHIATLEPCALNHVVWSIGYQDVIAVGKLFVEGVYPSERIVSLAGPEVRNPRLLRVTQGAFVTELVEGELRKGESRVISGSVLCGRTVEEGQEGLGRFVNQISVIGDGDPRALFGWTSPDFHTFSMARTVAYHWFFRHLPVKMNTAQGGGKRAVFPNRLFRKVMPLDILPSFLFKALEAGDLERSEKLGAFELDEEDVALCTLVDLGKNDYGASLRALLDKAMKEEE